MHLYISEPLLYVHLMLKTHVAFRPLQTMSIKTFAQEEGISFNEAVRRLVDVALHKLGKKKTPTETLLEWADDTFSGPTDLSSNDDYLYRL